MGSQWRLGCCIFVLLCVPLVSAASFGLDVVPLDNEILRSEVASYEITVSNYGEDDARFQAYAIDPLWNIATDPGSPLILAGQTDTFLLSLRPTTNSNYGTQGVSVNFKDLTTGSVITKNIVLNLRTGLNYFGEYEPTVALEVLSPYEIDPREDMPLRFELRNRNSLNISNLSIIVNSPHFSASTSLRLAPLSEKTIDIPGIVIDPLTPPGEAEMDVVLYYNGEVINRLEKNYVIQEYTGIREFVEESSFFFKTVKTLTVTNEGNVPNTALISVPSSFFKSLFTSSSLTYERGTEMEGTVLLWRIPLVPNETKAFTYIINYRILIFLLILAILGWIAYIFIRSPVVVIKEAVGFSKHGEVSRFKVRIFLRNRSSKLVRGLQVTDKIPSLAEMINAEAPGSVSPSKVAVSEKKGTLLRWNLEVLEPYEERVVTYQARSRLKIIGRMSLPNAKVKFTSQGKERVVFSNNIELVEKFKDK